MGFTLRVAVFFWLTLLPGFSPHCLGFGEQLLPVSEQPHNGLVVL